MLNRKDVLLPLAADALDNVVLASRHANVVTGAGLVFNLL